MISLRGDAHKFYLKLKKAFHKNQSVNDLGEIIEINDIQRFYHKLNTPELTIIYYRLLKEKKGNGIIPILVTALPWLAFIVSDQLQTLFKKGLSVLFLFLIVYTVVTTISIVIHYREKAWANVHMEIVRDIIKKRQRQRP